MAKSSAFLDTLSAQTPKFIEELQKTSELILNFSETIRIISHHDGDGITAAGILCNALLRKGKKLHISLFKDLEQEHIKKLITERNKLIIFCDMGSGQIEDLEKIPCDVIVYDHHKPLRASEKVFQINCNFFDIDGQRGASASTIAFALAIVIDSENWDLCPLSLAGAFADKQFIEGRFGLNKQIIEESVKREYILESRGLNLHSGLVKESIVNSINPYFRGLSGNAEATSKTLEALGIEPNSNFKDLSKLQLNSLASLLILRLVTQGVRPELAENFITARYWSSKDDKNIEDMSNYINACGRMEQMGVGLAVCLGDETALNRALKIRDEFRAKVRTSLFELEKKGLKTGNNIQYFYSDDIQVASSCAGLGMQFLFDQEKPVFAFSIRNGKLKISGRATSYLVNKGLDLASALREVSSELDGVGGGHPIASGATVPMTKEKAFLEKLDKKIGTQLMGT